MYTHREDAVEHAAEVRRQGQAICDEINKRDDRNCLSMTSSVEQSLTPLERTYVQIRAGEFDK
jgi:hypothetical protein